MFYALTRGNDRIFAERSVEVQEGVDLVVDSQGHGERHMMDRSEALDLVRALHDALDLPPLGARVR